MNYEPRTTPALRPNKTSRRWLRRALWLALALVALVLLIDGPIARWALPRIAQHYAAKLGIDLRFRVSGRLSAGLTLHDLSAIGGPIERLQFSRFKPLYHWRRAIDGEFDGFSLEGLSLIYDLDRSFSPTQPSTEKKPWSLDAFIAPWQQWQKEAQRYEIDLQPCRIEIRQGSRSLLAVNQLSLSHRANSDVWQLSNQMLQAENLPPQPPQQCQIRWTRDEFTLDQWRFHPQCRVEGLRLMLTQRTISIAANAEIAHSRWQLATSADLGEISLRQTSGKISTQEIRGIVPLDLPFDATVETANLLLQPRDWSMESTDLTKIGNTDLAADFSLSALRFDECTIDQLTVHLEKQGATFAVQSQAQAMGTDATCSISGSWLAEPTSIKDFSDAEITYQTKVSNIAPLLQQFAPSPTPKAPAPPSAAFLLEGKTSLRDTKISNITGSTQVTMAKATEPALSVNFSSKNLDAWSLQGKGMGIEIEGDFELRTQRYRAKLRSTQDDLSAFTPWLAWRSIIPPDLKKIDFRWQGEGNGREATHQGELDVRNIDVVIGNDAISGQGKIDYQWPESVTARDVIARHHTHEVRIEAAYTPRALAITSLRHRDGSTECFHATAQIPLPQSWKTIDDFLAQSEPWNLAVKSERLPLSFIDSWLARSSPLPISGEAFVEFRVDGSPAAPQFHGRAEINQIRALAQPDLAPSDIELTWSTQEQQLTAKGQWLSPQSPPISLEASIPFRPAIWAKDFATLLDESLLARFTLPKTDMARWAYLLPSLTSMKGNAEAQLDIAGRIGDPQIRGDVNIEGFSATAVNPVIPPMRDGRLQLHLEDRDVELRECRIELAGGSLTGKGRLLFPEDSPPLLDFQLRGDALPIWRSSAVISRANANLALKGPWDKAKIDGSIAIVDSLLYKDFEIIPYGKPLALRKASELPALDHGVDDAATALPAPFSQWALDVSIKTQDPFLIRGNLASGEVDLDCRILGTLGTPQPSGQAKIRDLLATLPLSRLSVPSGQIRFEPKSGLDPILDIKGFSRVSNYDINLYLYGTFSGPRILLTSTPPLPDHEIMTLLATGTTTKGLSDGSMAQSRAIQLLLEEFRRGRLPLGRRLAPFLERIDDVELAVGQPDPYSGRKRSSVKLPFAEHWSLFGGVDGEGKTRNLLLFQVKFR